MRGEKIVSDSLAIILAAGKGTRMNSSIPKPLIHVADYPIIRYIIDALTHSRISDIAIVIGHQADVVKSQLGDRYKYLMQTEQKGMAHAVNQAASLIAHYKNTLIFVGDSPLIQYHSIKRLIHQHTTKKAVCSFLTATFPIHFPYARVIRNRNGDVLRCVEECQATE